MSPDIEEDDAKEIKEDFESADEGISTKMRLTAGAQLVILFVAVVAGIALSISTGLITPSIVITATVNIGWIVEYLVIAVSGAFVLYVFTLLVIVMPGSILNLLGGLAYGAAVAAGLVEENDNN